MSTRTRFEKEAKGNSGMAYCEPRIYADDTHLIYAGDCVDNLQLYLNLGLENVHNWLRANKLTLNMTDRVYKLIRVYAHRFKAEIKYSHRFPDNHN